MPIRIEIGPRDVKENAVVLARRDKPGKEGKEFGVAMEGETVYATLDRPTIARDVPIMKGRYKTKQ